MISETEERLIKDFNMDQPEDEHRFLDASLSVRRHDKFQGFHQFVEKKLMEERIPLEEEKSKGIRSLKNIVSMRRLGTMLGLTKGEHEPRVFNQTSVNNTARNSLVTPTRTFRLTSHKTIHKIEPPSRIDAQTANVRRSKRHISCEKIEVPRRCKSLNVVLKDLEYYRNRFTFLKKTFLDNYPVYNSKIFKRLLLNDRDTCENHRDKLEQKEKSDAKGGIAKLKTFSEPWKEKSKSISKASAYGKFETYHLKQMIIKGGDDLRQEMIAMQLMKKFKEIFDKESTGCYLAPYDIIATSSDSGFLEFLTDTVPIDNLKKTNKIRLVEIYELIFRDSFETARKNFIVSLAGYSLFSYLLQIKDRHNGNILISSEGHILHIDFGFMFTTSPGNINFESAPFKLTKVR